MSLRGDIRQIEIQFLIATRPRELTRPWLRRPLGQFGVVLTLEGYLALRKCDLVY